MGYGLGKITPIEFSLGKNNFEALIGRHGQWLRWRIAKKCPCVTENNRHDIHCPKCGGSGDIYDYQRDYEDIFRATVRARIIAIPEEYTGAEIMEVYNSLGRKFDFCRYDDFVQIEDKDVAENEIVDVRIRASIVKTLKDVTLEKVGGGYYRVPGILTQPSKFEGVFYQAAGDVISVTGVMESTAEQEDEDEGRAVNVLGYRRDMILTDSSAAAITAAAVEYIMPFRFIVLSQNLSEEDLQLANAQKGDAVCTYPYIYNLSNNDVLTVLSGTMTHKIVISKKDAGIDDTIPEFFVSQVDSVETKTSAYKEGEDFILIGTNKIHWIGNQPEDDEAMSITFRYNPTYRVVKDIPMLRTSEDQRIPRKVALRLYGAFAEAKKVNSNG